jgi:hypothetical protein
MPKSKGIGNAARSDFRAWLSQASSEISCCRCGLFYKFLFAVQHRSFDLCCVLEGDDLDNPFLLLDTVINQILPVDQF